ncbi:hypothetical protein BDR07DRAFT_1352102 [Suillus spraguei]|nr:hypothetical protein BDR07DRAFT_1352102 [Suillus spraguei]
MNLNTTPNEMPQPLTRSSFSDIMVYMDAAFQHSVPSRSHKTVFGCVDYAVGHAFLHWEPGNLFSDKRFQSLILIVQAKVGSTVYCIVPQLLVYLACIRQSREARGRSDTTVYGAASNGYFWRFAMITHSGVIKVSQPFSVRYPGGTKIVLECLVFMIEAAASISPSMTPGPMGRYTARGQGDLDDYDPSLHIGRANDAPE